MWQFATLVDKIIEFGRDNTWHMDTQLCYCYNNYIFVTLSQKYYLIQDFFFCTTLFHILNDYIIIFFFAKIDFFN